MRFVPFLIFVLILVSKLGLTQGETLSFLNIEKITNEYSVGYTTYDEEFEGFGGLWILSKKDSLPVEGISENNCHLAAVSPNGRFACFEAIEQGWVYPSETDSFLHDRWGGAIVDLHTAKVVKYYRDDYGDRWDYHNLWLQGTTIVFNGNDTIQHHGETVFIRPEETLEGLWISYYETGEVKETGQSGNPFGCITIVGKRNFYKKNGKLEKSIYYENWMPENENGCHQSIQDQYVLEYSELYSHLKSRKMFQSVYEGDEYKTGIWQEFDKDGKLISSVDLGLKYDRLELQSGPVERWHPEITEIEIVNRSDTLLFIRDSSGWKSESLTKVDLKKLDFLIQRIERHQLTLQPSLIEDQHKVVGKIRFVASQNEHVYTIIQHGDRSFDAVCVDGKCYSVAMQGYVGILFTPFVANLDRWNWESPFLAAGLEDVEHIQFQSNGDFPNTNSSSEDYLKSFKRLKWHKPIPEPQLFEQGAVLGKLSVTHRDGVREYRLVRKKKEGVTGMIDDPDFFFLETDDAWFIATYHNFGVFLLYQK